MKHDIHSLQLTPRDEAILQMVYAFNGCMATHIHKRFFPKGSPCSACYRRLSKLTRAGYLVMYRLPSVSGQGSGKVLLQLGRKGRPVVAMTLGLPLSSMPRRPDICAPLFALHHEAICTFRVALQMAAQTLVGVAFTEWVNEAEWKRRPMRVEDSAPSAGQSARTITLIPDGDFALSYQGQVERGFLEMDMGTLSLKRLQLKLRGYLLNQETLRIPLFVVVPNQMRQAHVLRLAELEGQKTGADPSMFFVATADSIRPEHILSSPIWQQSRSNTPVAILPSVDVQEDGYESA